MGHKLGTPYWTQWHTITWNPNDPCFDWKGQMGSRYMCIYLIYINWRWLDRVFVVARSANMSHISPHTVEIQNISLLYILENSNLPNVKIGRFSCWKSTPSSLWSLALWMGTYQSFRGEILTQNVKIAASSWWVFSSWEKSMDFLHSKGVF